MIQEIYEQNFNLMAVLQSVIDVILNSMKISPFLWGVIDYFFHIIRCRCRNCNILFAMESQ